MLNTTHAQAPGCGAAPGLDEGLRRLLLCARQCADTLGLRPAPVPDDLAQLQGTLDGTRDGTPLCLRTERYSGQRLDSLTVAVLETPGGLCSLTVIGLPVAGAPFPILGIDLIALRGTISLCALDLAPLDEGFWQSRCAPVLCAVHAAAQESLVVRQRPRFAEDTFSPLALIAGVRPGREAAVFDAVELLLLRTVVLLTADPRSRPAPEHAREYAQEHARERQFAAQTSRLRRERWLLAERQNRKEHSALSRMFGPEAATRYLDGFLFANHHGEG